MRYKGEVLDGLKEKVDPVGTWTLIFSNDKDGIMTMFEEIEDYLRDPKAEKEWDKIQKDFVKWEKSVESFFKKHPEKLPPGN